MTFVRTLIVAAVARSWNISQMDVKMLYFMVIYMRKSICNHLLVLRSHFVMFVVFERLSMGSSKPLVLGLSDSVPCFKLLGFPRVSMTLHFSLIHLTMVALCFYSMWMISLLLEMIRSKLFLLRKI
jgi:hypothetical protein